VSKTLFWYVLKDLLKIFLMASGVLAGIMSFGGLLKPLMQFGLSGWQVAQMLMYFMPATQTYSLPIAAIFATTVVYGRLSADNELTACRAHGISYLTMALPAFILGLVLSLVSLVCLSYVVPRFTLKAEKVAFQSLAEVVQKNITRTHQIKLDDYVIYAESAELQPSPPDRPDDEIVILHGPMFCSFDRITEADGKTKVNVPSEFFTARNATAVIHQAGDHVEFTAYLDEGTTVPRELKGSATLGGLGAGVFGPVEQDSPIRENSKFMDIQQLKEIYRDPGKGRKVREIYAKITRQEQEQQFLASVLSGLKLEPHRYVFQNGNETLTLKVERGVRLPARVLHGKLTLISSGPTSTRDIHLERARGGEVLTTQDAWQLSLRPAADNETGRMKMQFDMADVLVGADENRSPRSSLSQPFSIPMPEELRSIDQRGPGFYSHRASAKSDDPRNRLAWKMKSLRNAVEAELHSRASFAMSCLILVMVGCALGMMFKTGNYLSAFALSVIPALISIALVVTGQHVSENTAANALKLGLSLIWGGNLAVLILAVGLLAHLRRQ
jgi:lipopolysaccharide export LptBFGC system permease protein LptF